ncbi:MAG: hypothetical protein R3Y59_03640 [bacterium]
MNLSIYFWKSTKKFYSQYPTDYTTSVFEDLIKRSNEKTRLVIYRNNNLVYYVYVNKTDSERVGICLVFNNTLFKELNILNNILTEAFNTLVASDEITTSKDLYKISNKLDCVSDSIKSNLKDEISYFVNIPTLNFGTNQSNISYITIESDNSNKFLDELKRVNKIFCYLNEPDNSNTNHSKKDMSLDSNNIDNMIEKRNKRLESIGHKLQQTTNINN